MRTTLNIDEEALAEAMDAAGHGKTKTQVINEALRAFARKKRLLELLELKGKIPWEGDVDALRERA